MITYVKVVKMKKYVCPVCLRRVGVRRASGKYYKHKHNGVACLGSGTDCNGYIICHDYRGLWFTPNCMCDECYDESMEHEINRLSRKND